MRPPHPRRRSARSIAIAGALPITLMAPALLGPGSECVGGVGDVVLRAVARGVAHAVLPCIALRGPVGPLAEGGLHPRAGGLQFVLGELVAQGGVLLGGLGDRVLEAFAFGTGLDGVAELALQTAALRADRVELALVGLQGGGEVGAFDRVGVVFASEAPVWLGQAGEALGELLVLGGEREGARVEVLDALQLVVSAALRAALAAARRARAAPAAAQWSPRPAGWARRGRLRAPVVALSRVRGRRRGRGRLCGLRRELLDREVFVVALQHPTARPARAARAGFAVGVWSVGANSLRSRSRSSS